MLRSDEARSFMKIPICSVLGKWGSKWPKKESFAVNQLKFFNWPLYQINLLIVLVINYWTKMLSANQILRILSFSWTKSEIWWVYRYRYVQICLILCKILRWFTRPTGLVLAISTMLSLCFDYSQPINFRILFLAISVEEIKRTILMIDIQRDKREQKGKRKIIFFPSWSDVVRHFHYHSEWTISLRNQQTSFSVPGSSVLIACVQRCFTWFLFSLLLFLNAYPI